MIKEFLAYFTIHRRFRNGVFSLIFLISILGVGLFMLSQKEADISNLVVLDAYEQELVVLKEKAAAQQKAFVQKPFNPNFISDYKGYVLGLSPQVLDKLRAYRATDKWINSAQEFQVVTGVNDLLLSQIGPLFKFPIKKTSYYTKKSQHSTIKTEGEKSDLNKITAVQLQEVVRLPDFVAMRIIKYRKSLGGFVSDAQLQDVYGLYPKQIQKVLSLFTVKEKRTIERLDVHTASVKELMTIPYFDFEMALAIHDFVKENGKIKSFYEFDKILGFPTDKIDRITLYLKI